MNKFILVIFALLFINSISHSSTKDIQLSKGLKKNIITVFNCKNKKEEKISITIIDKNLNPPIVLWSKNEDELYPYSLLSSYLFYDKTIKNYIFYQNLMGEALTKYYYSFEEIVGSFETKNKFKVYRIGFPTTAESKNSTKLYKDWEKIVSNWALNDLILKKFDDRTEHKKLENYSNSLKELFEKQHEELNKKEIVKKFIENDEFICNTQKYFNINC